MSTNLVHFCFYSTLFLGFFPASTNLQKIREIYSEKIRKHRSPIVNSQTWLKPAKSPDSKIMVVVNENKGEKTNLRQKIIQKIEQRFKKSEINRTYVFPRQISSGASEIGSNESSLDSIKALGFYDLREQNQKKKEFVQNSSLKEKFAQLPKENKKFISGKYQILKGRSLLNGFNSDSIEICDPNSCHQSLSKIKHSKNQTGSGDLKGFLKKPIEANPLYLLAQSHLSFKKGNLRIIKGFSGNLEKITGKKRKEINWSNDLSRTFLEINSMKLTQQIPVSKASNSFKITTYLNKSGQKK